MYLTPEFTVQVILPIILAFFIVLVIGPFLIPYLRKKKVGNTEREELESHQVKSGTPSMGGIMILAAIVVVSLIYAPHNPRVLPVMLVSLGFGIIGFLDDFLKAHLHRSDGLMAKQKFGLQILVVVLFLIYLLKADVSLQMLVPFTAGRVLTLGWVAFPVMFLAILGTVNGVNFTDGLDGLASTVTLPVAAFFLICSMLFGAGVTPVAAAVIGALLGFLVFNCYPAKIFMGDTGSLALGGFVAATAYMMQMPIFILIAGLIYWIEILSVMIQVAYFKKTGGKRIFRMAPIHHHFELGGWSEVKVVAVFSILTTLLCLAALIRIM